jgi:hypothetical protein
LNARPEPEGEGPRVTPEVEQDEAGRLLVEFRAGDRSSGYELLGRQASLDQWKAVLDGFAAEPADVDLERIAGSMLGRHPQIAGAFLDLLAQVGTAQALFIASATRHLREEPHLVERAAGIEATLLETNKPLLDNVGESDGVAALYVLLTLPLTEQRERWLLWKEALPDQVVAVEHAIGAEDERLQRLSKERSYRSGTYLHFLRHALANLVLVIGLEGPIGQRAFGLLQRRVDDAEQQEELLEVAPEDVRRRYLAWTLESRNAAVSLRTRFALRMLRERFPDLANGDALVALARGDDSDVATDAVVTGLTVRCESRALDAEVVRLLNTLDIERAERVAAALVRVPERIALPRIAAERRNLLFSFCDSSSEDFARSVFQQLLYLPGEEIAPIAAQLETLTSTVVADGFRELVRDLLERARRDPACWRALVDCLDRDKFRQATWAVLPTADELVAPLMRAAVAAEAESERAARVAEVLANSEGTERELLADAALATVFDGLADAAQIATAWPNDLRAHALAAAVDAREKADQEHEQIESQLRHGADAHRQELGSSIDPLIALAAARAEGNAHLEEGYARLRAALHPDTATTTPSQTPSTESAERLSDVSIAVSDELAALGATFNSETGTICLSADGADAARRLRYLGVLDQRAQRGDPDQRGLAAQLLPPYTAALAESGLAEEALRGLFEGGALLPVVVQLSANTRRLMLEAAVARGFIPPAEWLEHPALGEWLRALGLRSTGAPTEDAAVDAATLATSLRLAQEASSALEAARVELDRQRHAEKESMMRVAAPVFEEIDALIDSYTQLWQGLGRLGIDQVAPLGTMIAPEAVNPARHEIVAVPKASRFVVRSPGVVIDGDVVVRARLEGVES